LMTERAKQSKLKRNRDIEFLLLKTRILGVI
jgi:hypothetical protein